MKTLIKPLLIVISLFLAANSISQAQSQPQPGTSFQSGIFTTIDGKLQVALNKQVGKTVEISLTNASGQVLYSHKLTKQQTTARLRLDVSSLPDGAYQLAITNGKETTQHALTIGTTRPQESNRLVAIN